MLYRGFVIDTVGATTCSRWNNTEQRLDQCPGVICEVYDQYDDDMTEYLDTFTLAEGYEVLDFSTEQLQIGMRNYADAHISNLNCMKNEVIAERKNQLVGRLVCWIGEEESGADLYNTLSEHIGMTDEEIRACGFTSLVPYFNREGYAQTIAEYMIQIGTEETTTCDWHFGFEDLNTRFGLNLNNDEEMVRMIRNELYRQLDIVNDVDVYNDEFDVLFYPEFCPYVDKEEMETGLCDQQL